MAEITPERRARDRARMITYYKSRLGALWTGLESEWADVYAYDNGGYRDEPWPGNDLWSTRYGSLSESGGVGDDGALTTTSATDLAAAEAGYAQGAGSGLAGDFSEEGAHDAAANRSGLAARLTTDGINAWEQMTDEEFDEYAYDSNGNWKGLPFVAAHPKFGTEVVFEKLKIHLKDTSGQNGEDNVADTLLASDDHNMLTGNLMERGKEEEVKAAAATPPDIPTPVLSRAGIAYDTVEYREQCFLLSQVFHIVEHRINNLVNTEYKPLPYLNEAVTPSTSPIPTNSSVMIDALTPYAFINRLTHYPEQQKLINMATSDLSQLQPKIRLFRVTESTNASTSKLEEVSTEILFDTSTTRQDLEEFMKPTGKRGFGAGIKSFNVNYEASNPFALKKSISAELTIFANTFDELTRDRGNYSYIDLALKTGGRKTLAKFDAAHSSKLNASDQAKRYNLSKLNFRLKAVVGWATPPGVKGFSTPTINNTLNSSFITINLTPTIHTFDFDDTGRVTFKIQYLAYIDDFFDEPSFSILSDYKTVEAQKQRELDYKLVRDTCDSEAIADFKEKNNEVVAKELASGRASIWERLNQGTNLRYINLKYSSLRKYAENPAYYDLKKAEKEAFEILNLEDASKGMKNGLAASIQEYADNPTAAGHGHKDRKKASSMQQVSLVYFYVSDLVDVLLESIDKNLDAAVEYYTKRKTAGGDANDWGAAAYHDKMKEAWGLAEMAGNYNQENYSKLNEQQKRAVNDAVAGMHAAGVQSDLSRSLRLRENFKRYRAVLGPIEILNMANPGKSLSVNIGDLPISLKYFMEWLTGRTLAKSRPSYSISAFLSDFINGLLNGFINDKKECFKGGMNQSKQKTRLCQTAITAYNREENTTDAISLLLADYRSKSAEYQSLDASRLHLHYHNASVTDGDSESTPSDNWRPIKSWPLLEVSGPPGSPITSRGLSREINYICYYAGRNSPNEKMNGDSYEDISRGVMHYTAGKDRGIVKTIKFKKTEAPGLGAVRWEQEGYDGLAQLREVYNVTIDTYANVSAFPGSYVFVNPLGLAPNMTFNSKIDPEKISAQDLSTYGIGGYYMITRAAHSFGPGIANTRLDAVWVAAIGSDKKDESSTGFDATNTDGNPVTKCQHAGTYDAPSRETPEAKDDVATATTEQTTTQ